MLNEQKINKMKKHIDEMLLAMTGSELLVQRWWHSQNWHFKLEKPYIVWETDPQSVYNYVAMHANK